MAIHAEWLNSNALRTYPFQENMARVPHDALGNDLTELALPNCAILDMVLSISADPYVSVYLSQFTLLDTLATFVFRDVATDAAVTSCTVIRDEHTPNRAYKLVGLNDWEDARGWLVVGDLNEVTELIPYGVYTYANNQTVLEATVIRPALRGVTSLRTMDSTGAVSDALYGTVKLMAGSNIRFEAIPDDNAIIIHADPNTGYVEECECGEGVATRVVSTINGISTKNVVIDGDGRDIEVTNVGNVIKIRNLNAEPCCGCPELDFITNTNKLLEQSIRTLEAYADVMTMRISSFLENYSATLGLMG